MTLAAVFLASVVGSLHCAGMCGGFAAVVAGTGRRRWGPILAYHLTRLVAYGVLGVAAGAVGAGFDLSFAATGIGRISAPIMGTLVMVLAARMLWRGNTETAGARPVQIGTRPPGRLRRAQSSLTARIRNGGVSGATAAGLLTGLLPCAWLWTYVLLAAGQGSTGSGAAVMIAFWAGTVPALVAIQALTRLLSTRASRHAPRITAFALFMLGLLTVLWWLPSVFAQTELGSIPGDAPCHVSTDPGVAG